MLVSEQEGGRQVIDMEQLEMQVFSYMEAHSMIEEGETVCAAVSGGADSVCLLLLLAAYRRRKRFFLQAVHVEHGIRGEESLEDARFVEGLCASLEIPLLVRHVRAAGYADEQGLSLEEAARDLRYQVFSGMAERLKPGVPVRIALAHHREDQAETVLFNLVRGTGLQGLGGMRPVRDVYIRPLLETGRKEIRAYLEAGGYTWREDSSNADTAYTRNLIRHRILPLLTENVNLQAVSHICEAAGHAADAAAYLDRQAHRFMEQHMREKDGQVILETDPLRREERIIREYVLRAAVAAARGGTGLKDIGAVHIRDLDALIFKPRGKHLDLPGYLKACRVERTLVLGVERGK